MSATILSAVSEAQGMRPTMEDAAVRDEVQRTIVLTYNPPWRRQALTKCYASQQDASKRYGFYAVFDGHGRTSTA